MANIACLINVGILPEGKTIIIYFLIIQNKDILGLVCAGPFWLDM